MYFTTVKKKKNFLKTEKQIRQDNGLEGDGVRGRVGGEIRKGLFEEITSELTPE